MINDRSSNTSRDDDVDEERGNYDYEIFLDVCNALQESDAESSVEYVTLFLIHHNFFSSFNLTQRK